MRFGGLQHAGQGREGGSGQWHEGLARGEEHRRVVATSTSRMGNRFDHFFAQNEVFIGQMCLDRLCNSI